MSRLRRGTLGLAFGSGLLDDDDDEDDDELEVDWGQLLVSGAWLQALLEPFFFFFSFFLTGLAFAFAAFDFGFFFSLARAGALLLEDRAMATQAM